MNNNPFTEEQAKKMLEGKVLKSISIVDGSYGSDIIIEMQDGTIVEFQAQIDAPVWILDKTPKK